MVQILIMVGILLVMMLLIIEFATMTTYGWFVSNRRGLELLENIKNSPSVHFNIFDKYIYSSYDSNYFFSKLPFITSLFSKYYISHRIKPNIRIFRWSKLHRELENIYNPPNIKGTIEEWDEE